MKIRLPIRIGMTNKNYYHFLQSTQFFLAKPDADAAGRRLAYSTINVDEQ